MHHLVTISCIAAAICGQEPPGIDPDHRLVWGENIGWIDGYAELSEGPILGVQPTYLSGFAWGENVGWLNFGDGSPGDGIAYANIEGADAGVNIDPDTGELYGLAWGENIGWIKFGSESQMDSLPYLDECTHRIFGFAWSENVGWINFDDDVSFWAIGPCVASDLDCDGAVTVLDVADMIDHWQGPIGTKTCAALDTDADGNLDLADFAIMQQMFAVCEP